jgi:NADH-quinone oxidoreductase subunit G
VRNDTRKLWKDLDDKAAKVTVQVAPAVRVALGRGRDLPEGKTLWAGLWRRLRRMGFDEVFDTSTGADLTVLEESNELMKRLEKNEELPLFTSCCPLGAILRKTLS